MANNKSDQPLVILEKIVGELFKLMKITSSFSLTEDADNNAYLVDISTSEEAGLLIGNHGKTLNSLQTVISLIFRQKTGEWKRIIINIADWREKEQLRIEDLARKTADRVKETGESQTLYNLTPSQRRTVHMLLANDDRVSTESQGEGKERYLVVSPK